MPANASASWLRQEVRDITWSAGPSTESVFHVVVLCFHPGLSNKAIYLVLFLTQSIHRETEAHKAFFLSFFFF